MNLYLGPGSYLDLAGKHLYYLTGRIDPTATIVGGAPILVPAVGGDATLDGIVDVGDLAVLAGCYGVTSNMTWGQGDFSGDGMVDVSDLAVLAGQYGKFGEPAPVPEPATLCLLAVGAAAIRRRRA